MSLILNIHSFLDTSTGFTLNRAQHNSPSWLLYGYALVWVIKQNQAFSQRGDSSFTFNLCSLEPDVEDAYLHVTLAGPLARASEVSKNTGNAGFETSYEEQQKKLPNVQLGSITEIILQNMSRRLKYSESLFVNY